MIGTEELRNVIVDSVNARDPELLERVELEGIAGLQDEIETLNERFPRVMMTRGDLADRPVAVVWMPNRNERYEKVGHVEVIPEEGGPHTEFVEEIDASLIAEDPPGLTVAEWESARELDRGEGRWT